MSDSDSGRSAIPGALTLAVVVALAVYGTGGTARDAAWWAAAAVGGVGCLLVAGVLALVLASKVEPDVLMLAVLAVAGLAALGWMVLA